MSTLYLIRHSESVANDKRILASRLPYPLTDAGKADADLIAIQLKKKVTIKRIISSPLVRARQTARFFENAFNLTAEIDDRITEQDLGIYKGMSYDEVKLLESYEKDPRNRWNWIPEGGGESYSMIAERIISFFTDLERGNKDENILIVTHAVSFRLIQAVLKNTLPHYPESFPNNGEIWKVDFTGVGNEHKIESIFLGNSRDFVHNP
ncbi:MAG: histidine phosphatase family protein [Spirochaetaceae bacterium]|nr:histidine phosphatase family protein [Spirochaetaceae bacterium]